MLYDLRTRNYSRNMTDQVQLFVVNNPMCFCTEPCHNKTLTPPLEQIYDPCNGPEDILGIDSVSEQPSSNSYTYIVRATDGFLRYLFAIPIQETDAVFIDKTPLTTNSAQHAYVLQKRNFLIGDRLRVELIVK